MTTRQRLDLLARAFPRLFPRRQLENLLRAQLGRVDALDAWASHSGTQIRARAPQLIYHVCAGNLAVSAWTSLMHGLLLGARNAVKLPSAREESSARREILEFIAQLPPPVRKLVEIHRVLDEKALARADVIVAFGSDATMESLRRRTRADQRFIAHGHAVSLLWFAGEPTPRAAAACAIDILTYDQLGCLSPQAIYFPPGTDAALLGTLLAQALEKTWRRIAAHPPRPLAVAARIHETRDVAFARGHRVWLPPKNHLGWTIVLEPDPAFRASPLHGVIYLRQAATTHLHRALQPVAGRISTVGLAGDTAWGKTSSRWRDQFLSLGVSRFCAAGRMQFPPLTWHHDGRPVLADLVRWVEAETARQ